VEFEPFRWFPGVVCIRRGLAIDVVGYLAEILAATAPAQPPPSRGLPPE
jgi:hypothetical protein